MGKPVPPRLPPVRVLNAEQNAFIQSLEPQTVHVMPVTESTEQPSDPSPDRLVSMATEQPSDPSPDRLVSMATERLGDQSPHTPMLAAFPRPVRSRANKRQGRALFERADGKAVRKLSFYLPADLAKSLQIHCVTSERDMSTFVTELVRRALAKANV